MSVLRGILHAPAWHRTKWLVLVFWLVILVVAFPLSGKLTGAEKNDSSAWLPSRAESTQVLNLRSTVVSPNVFPAVMVYDRPAGVTQADFLKAQADARAFTSVSGVQRGQVIGPIMSGDKKKAIETPVPVDL